MSFQWVHFSCFNSWLMITSQYLPTSLRAVLLVTEYNAADIFLLLFIPSL